MVHAIQFDVNQLFFFSIIAMATKTCTFFFTRLKSVHDPKIQRLLAVWAEGYHGFRQCLLFGTIPAIKPLCSLFGNIRTNIINDIIKYKCWFNHIDYFTTLLRALSVVTVVMC